MKMIDHAQFISLQYQNCYGINIIWPVRNSLMDCRILRHITLKSNGHFGCDDSVGYGIDLGHVSLEPGWRLKDIINGPIYRHIRNSFSKGQVPWPGTCEGCDLFSAGASPNDTIESRLELLVEPTLNCNISCACCIRKQIINNGRNIKSLDPKILETFFDACKRENIFVEYVHYIGWGEPLLHDRFSDLVDIVKIRSPQTIQVVTTAANIDFKKAIGSSLIDKIVVSADGANQNSYEKYRRRGAMENVIKFMRDCKRYGHSGIFLEWKYILFEWNDSDDDLLEAQILAEEIGVDSLLFIITNSKWNSQRFTSNLAEEFPFVTNLASITPAAAMCAVAHEAEPFVWKDDASGFIDKCTISVGRFLDVHGWAYDGNDYPKFLELIVNDEIKAKSRPYLVRYDAFAARPDARGAMCGFMFRIPIKKLPDVILVRVVGERIYELGGATRWRSAHLSVKQRKDLGNYLEL